MMTPKEASARVEELCRLAPVIPVIVVDDVADATPLAEALIDGGLVVLEVTMRTPQALDAIRKMSQVPGGVVGAGTLLTPSDVEFAKAAGALFGVSPGCTDEILDVAEEAELPMLPGAATASDAMRLLARGYTVQKFFPAEAAGGPAMLKALGGPMPQVRFCPTGGITVANARRYLDLPNVLCVGGSWIARKELLRNKDWTAIRALAEEASTIMD